ncbi:MAG: hypothetical protein AAF724_05300 [Pseudomonadota bacterium]
MMSSEFSDPGKSMEVLGVLSGVLIVFAYVPYIVDTSMRRIRPQRASWLVWTVLSAIAFVSQVYEGAGASLWFAGVQVSVTVVVLCLSIRVGADGCLKKSDYMILACAAAGLVLWYYTDTPAYALAVTISISLLAGSATVVKAYRDPGSETMVTWAVSLIASICAMLSVGRVDPILLAYPLYLFTLKGAIVLAIILGRNRRRNLALISGIPRHGS